MVDKNADDALKKIADEVEAEREAKGRASFDVDEPPEGETREDHQQPDAGPLDEDEADDVPMGAVRKAQPQTGPSM